MIGGMNEPVHDDCGPLTVPNALAVLRMVGAGGLLVLAWADQAGWFIALFLVLLATDWIDGKLALLLRQRTVLGARLDSAGDFVLFTCLAGGLAILRPDFIATAWWALVAVLASWLLPAAITVIRFRRPPAFHTRLAKVAWWLVTITAIVLLAGGPAWPALVALLAVVVANLEATWIALVLPAWRADVPSIMHARRTARS